MNIAIHSFFLIIYAHANLVIPWIGIPTFDGKTNPRKFIASYETAVFSIGGDVETLAKSLILAVEDIAHRLVYIFEARFDPFMAADYDGAVSNFTRLPVRGKNHERSHELHSARWWDPIRISRDIHSDQSLGIELVGSNDNCSSNWGLSNRAVCSVGGP